jgi:hypothetical protein
MLFCVDDKPKFLVGRGEHNQWPLTTYLALTLKSEADQLKISVELTQLTADRCINKR